MKAEHDYSDIIGLEHHRSENYPPMPEDARAAQFAPFAALAGFEEIIEETARRHVCDVDKRRASEFDESI